MKKGLLIIGCLLMVAGISLAMAVPITSNTVHVSYTAGTSYTPTLYVIQEGDSISETLEAKTAPSPSPSNPYGLWTVTPGGASGTFTYNTVGTTFDVSYSETDGKLEINTGYSLIYYADNTGWTGIGPVTTLATGTSDGSGDLTISTTSVTLGYDLPVPSDANYPMGAKIWLVPTSDVSGTTLTWDPTSFLLETALIHYHHAAPLANTVDLWATIPTPVPPNTPALDSQTPAVPVHFYISTDGKVTWTELTGSPITAVWGLYCGFAGTVEYTFGVSSAEVDFGVSATGSATVITITPPYPQ